MKILIIFAGALLLAISVQAEDIYKWVDSEGNVHYGDEPRGTTAKKMTRLPGLSTYSPPPVVEESKPDEAAEGDASAVEEGEPEDALPAVVYREIKLIKPENEETIRSNEGQVDLFVALSPVLEKGDYFKVALDGASLPQKYSSTVISLSGIDRGEHTVAVAVYNKAGVKQIESAAHKFYLHQATVVNKSPRS